LPEGKRKSHSKNAPKDVQVRKHLKRISGVDLTAPGTDDFDRSWNGYE
jgi:hypothetical protein